MHLRFLPAPLRAAFAMLAASVLLLAFPRALSASQSPSQEIEYKLKAAYLYNFTKFVEWPAPAATPFVIGVVDPEGGTSAIIAETLRDKTTSDGRPIEVRHLARLDPSAAGCQQLFLTRAAALTPATAREAIGSAAVLIVGETDDFASNGGAIGLIASGNSVRCELNLAAAQRARLKLSSRLASVARLVRETAQP